MTELKTAVCRSRGVGFLEDHTQASNSMPPFVKAMNIDTRAEPQLPQLTGAAATK